MKKLLPFLFLFFTGTTIPPRYKTYFEEHKLKANLLEYSTGVPTSIQFAQAIFESGCGRSRMAKQANNHFGIKCGDNWDGQTYKEKSCWRSYQNVGLSYLDHACFLSDNYSGAVGKPWRHWVKHCRGYGGEGYWQKIGEIIEIYKLYQYDIYGK